MEEFDNLKMEHAFMGTKLLIYQKRSKRNQVKQWELYKEQIDEIMREGFKSYRKNEEFHQLCFKTY
jgi:hypothetical protein